jgi:thiol-disulfide isomerase/thioredoxin
MMARTIKTTILSLSLVFFSWARAAEVPLGEPLPGVTLHGLNGPARSLADFRGRPLLINVWASWCGPCRQEMGSLERLAWRDAGPHFAIIGISTDDDPQLALALLHSSRATLSHFIDAGRQMESLLGASHIPLTVLVDAQGRVRARYYGAREWDSPAALQLLRAAFGAHELGETRAPVTP